MNIFTFIPLILVISTSTAFAANSEESVKCKAQLARASERATEVLPQNATGFKGFKFDGLHAKGEFVFSLNGQTEKVYTLKLKFKLEPSNWASVETPNLKGFTTDIEIWDTKENKLLSAQKDKSDNVRTRSLLFKLIDQGTATLVKDSYNLTLREELLNSKSEKIQNFVEKGDWINATIEALETGDVNAYEADFTSLLCIYQNKNSL